MKKTSVTILNYNVGNYGSLTHSLKKLGFYVRVSEKVTVLEDSDVVILPGVGAFPTAMEELENLNLVGYLKKRAMNQKPIIGICLGMQLLTEYSSEHQHTLGLGLIPGKFVGLENPKWHIGWNTLQYSNCEKINNGEFYFNHAYIYNGLSEYIVCSTTHKKTFASIIQSGNIVGLQFHPEKSQSSGKELLYEMINELCNA